MSQAPDWDPAQYARFQEARDRAALDLMLRLPDDLNPHEIWDLGCGAGQHASLLRRRHPGARVHGLDNSPAMLAEARALDDAVDWRLGDIAGWTPGTPPDLILANASLQWLADPVAEIGRLAGLLAPGGVLAVQTPAAFETRHYAILRAVAAEGPWAERLGAGAGVGGIGPTPAPDACYDAASAACAEVDVWSTTYLHVLAGAGAVLEWMKGTALRPHLTALADAPPLSAAFLSALGARLSEAFPRRADGVTLLPFPRLFLVARR